MFANSEDAETTTERGRLLEELMAYLFGRCPGVRHYRNNALTLPAVVRSMSVFGIVGTTVSFDFLPALLIVECKNTNERVGSAEIRVFLSKLRDMGLDHGIFDSGERYYRARR